MPLKSLNQILEEELNRIESTEHCTKGYELLINQGNIDEAIEDNRKAVQLDPENAIAHHNLGVSFDRKGRLDEAIAEYEEAVKLDSRYVLAYHNLGDIWNRKGNLQKAKSNFQEAVRLGHKDSINRLTEIEERIKKERIDELVGIGYDHLQHDYDSLAVRLFENVLELDPKNFEAHKGLGYCYLYRKDYGEAYRLLKKAREYGPQNMADQFEVTAALNTALQGIQNKAREDELRKLKKKSNQNNNKPKSLVRKVLSYIGAFVLVAAVGISYLSNKKIDNKLQQVTTEKNILEKQMEDYSIHPSCKESEIKNILVKNGEYENRIGKLSKQLETEREKSMRHEQQAEEYNTELGQTRTELEQSLGELDTARAQNEEYGKEIEEQAKLLEKEKEKSKFLYVNMKEFGIDAIKANKELASRDKELIFNLNWLNGMVRLAAGNIKKGEEKIKEYEGAIPFLEKVKERIGDDWLIAAKFKLGEALKEKEESSVNEVSRINSEDIDWDLHNKFFGKNDKDRRYNLFVNTICLLVGSNNEGASSYGANFDYINDKSILTYGVSFIENGGEPWEEDHYYNWKNEFGLCLGAGLRIKEYSDLFLLGTLGYSTQVVKNGKSTIDRKNYFNWSAELRYMYKHLVLGCGYHNRRGIMAGIGVGF